MNDKPDTLFESLGGAHRVAQVVADFYQRILADEELRPFFRDVQMERLQRMQTEFISAMIDGPIKYSGAELTEIHHGRGIEEKHFSRFVAHIADTLQEHAVAPELIDQILGRLALYSNQITGSANVDG